MGLIHRITRLEQRTEQGQPPPLFIRRAGQVAGWRSGDNIVWRRDNETEVELQDRITAEYGGPVLWVSIKPEKEI